MHSRTSFFSCEKLVPSWSQLYSVQVSRASFSYDFLGQRTWVICHGLKRTGLYQVRLMSVNVGHPHTGGDSNHCQERHKSTQIWCALEVH